MGRFGTFYDQLSVNLHNFLTFKWQFSGGSGYYSEFITFGHRCFTPNLVIIALGRFTMLTHNEYKILTLNKLFNYLR